MGARFKITDEMVEAAVNAAIDEAVKDGADRDELENRHGAEDMREAKERFSEVVRAMLNAAATVAVKS